MDDYMGGGTVAVGGWTSGVSAPYGGVNVLGNGGGGGGSVAVGGAPSFGSLWFNIN